jgi:hypothetical protein
LQQLVDNPGLVREYGRKGWMYGKENHDIQIITRDLKQDFTAFISYGKAFVL